MTKLFISSSMNVKTWIELQLQGWQHWAIKGSWLGNEYIYAGFTTSFSRNILDFFENTQLLTFFMKNCPGHRKASSNNTEQLLSVKMRGQLLFLLSRILPVMSTFKRLLWQRFELPQTFIFSSSRWGKFWNQWIWIWIFEFTLETSLLKNEIFSS